MTFEGQNRLKNGIPHRKGVELEAKSNGVTAGTTEVEDEETMSTIASEVFGPFVCAGLGMVLAGTFLDSVQDWPVFKECPEIFILIPALLGLKGNLEMTLASRLSTEANLGSLDDPEKTWSLATANLGLVQVQGIVVGALAAIIALLFGWLPLANRFDLDQAFLLCASSVVTASLASFILGCVMVIVVIVSRRHNVNPDNIATPIAASLGDLTTLLLLSYTASGLHTSLVTNPLIAPTILFGYLGVLPFCVQIAKSSESTALILRNGWTPVLNAMVISSIGGKILNKAVVAYPAIAGFQPVINGIAGNLASVQASRISTSLHQSRLKFGEMFEDVNSAHLFTITSTFCSTSLHLIIHSKTAKVLLAFVVPGHIIFNNVIASLQSNDLALNPMFLVFYLPAALLQVGFLLCVANYLVHDLWKRSVDPDNAAIPYLTALGDLLGGSLLFLAFHFHHVFSS